VNKKLQRALQMILGERSWNIKKGSTDPCTWLGDVYIKMGWW